MAEFTVERTIQRPVDNVFAFVADFRNGPQWQAGIEDLRVEPDGPAQVGTRVRERRRLQGHVIDLSYTVTALEPGRRIEVRSAGGPVGYSGVQHFAPAGGGGAATRLRFELDVQLTGGMRLLAGFIAPAIRRQVESDLDRLAWLLENPT